MGPRSERARPLRGMGLRRSHRALERGNRNPPPPPLATGGRQVGPRKRGDKTQPTPVAALRHTDRRANIPTNELRRMLADDERSPSAMLYPRDPSLDPQLVWKG